MIYLIRIPHEGTMYYMGWRNDRPTTEALSRRDIYPNLLATGWTREEATEHLAELDRAKHAQAATRYWGRDLKEAISDNRAGPQGRCLSLDGIIRMYILDETIQMGDSTAFAHRRAWMKHGKCKGSGCEKCSFRGTILQMTR